MRRGLGKGLSQLIAEQVDVPQSDAAISQIIPNRQQPRSHFDQTALEELAASIREHGILQPLLVRPHVGDQFELIAGERRWRAAQLAGLERVPILVRTVSNQTNLELALIENLQREDIGPLECARAYRQLIDDFGLTQDKVAERVGKSRTSIANTLRLLKLPALILDGLESGAITEGHARAILSLITEIEQIALFQKVVAGGLSVRQTEALTQPKLGQSAKPAKPQDPNWEALEDTFAKKIGYPVSLKRGPNGSGRIVVDFYSDDDLEKIMSVLGLG